MKRTFWQVRYLLFTVLMLGMACHTIEDLPDFGPLPTGDKQAGDLSDYRYLMVTQRSMEAHSKLDDLFQEGFDFTLRLLDLRKWKRSYSPENIQADTLYYLTNGSRWIRREADTGQVIRLRFDTVQFIEDGSPVQFPDDRRWTELRWYMCQHWISRRTGDSISLSVALTWTGQLSGAGFVEGTGTAAIRGRSLSPTAAGQCQFDYQLNSALDHVTMWFGGNTEMGGCPEGGVARYVGTVVTSCTSGAADFQGPWSVEVSFGPEGITIFAENTSTRWSDTLTCSEWSASD